MSFNEKDKDYFFALLENILKCMYFNSGVMTGDQRDKMKKEVRDFMVSRELLEDEKF